MKELVSNCADLTALQCFRARQAVNLHDDTVARAIAMRDHLHDLVRHVSKTMEVGDVDLLEEAIKRCQQAGLPARYTDAARTTLETLQKLLAALQAALVSRDLIRLTGSISDCQQAKIPLPYLQEAIDTRQHVQGLRDVLQRACDVRDVQAIDNAVQDGMMRCSHTL